MGGAGVEGGLVELAGALEQGVDLRLAGGQQHAVLLGVGDADGASDGGDLVIEENAGVGGEGGVDTLAGGQKAEGVLAAPAVAGDSDLGDAGLAARERNGLGNDGVLSLGRVLGEEGAHVEGREVEIRAERLAAEHVGRNRQVARACEAVGEQLVLEQLNAKDIRQVDDGDVLAGQRSQQLLNRRARDIRRDYGGSSVMLGALSAGWTPFELTVLDGLERTLGRSCVGDDGRFRALLLDETRGHGRRSCARG